MPAGIDKCIQVRGIEARGDNNGGIYGLQLLQHVEIIVNVSAIPAKEGLAQHNGLELDFFIVPMAIRFTRGTENHGEVDPAVSDNAVVHRHAVRRRNIGNQSNPGQRMRARAQRVVRR